MVCSQCWIFSDIFLAPKSSLKSGLFSLTFSADQFFLRVSETRAYFCVRNTRDDENYRYHNVFVRGVSVETGGGERKSGGSGNAASPFGADRRLGDSANRKARERFATVVSDWTIARVGCRVYVRGDFVVPVSVAIVVGECEQQRRHSRRRRGALSVGDDANVARGERGQ